MAPLQGGVLAQVLRKFPSQNFAIVLDGDPDLRPEEKQVPKTKLFFNSERPGKIDGAPKSTGGLLARRGPVSNLP
jgi:hypothetical protein